MLNALLQLIGLRRRERREVWHEKPCVITDEAGTVVFSGTATIEYMPGEEAYERGHADIFDEDSGERIYTFEISGQQIYSTLNQANPYRVRWSRLGLTARATDKEGSRYKLYVGRQAHAFVMRGRVLDDGSGDVSEVFTDVDPSDGSVD